MANSIGLPDSYTSNTDNELELLKYVDNLRLQYQHLNPDRKPLFICPLNEANVCKLVCTTIKPTVLSESPISNHLDAVKFVSDYITYRSLENAYILPNSLASPDYVLQTQTGNCFEISTLLVSLLTGMGYETYCCSGYATREICTGDLSNYDYPELSRLKRSSDVNLRCDDKETAKTPTMPKFRSNYDDKMRERALKEKAITITIANEDTVEAQSIRLVHSWVLCLPDKMLIDKPFFIEPSTGQLKEIHDRSYIAIESVWNNTNYWINCHTHTPLSFDLNDTNTWEKIFLQPNVIEITNENYETVQTVSLEMQDVLQRKWLPLRSWVRDLNTIKIDFAKQFPTSQKVMKYKKTIVKKFSNYFNKNGCVLEILQYRDDGMCTLERTMLEFDQRIDCLVQRNIEHDSGLITDFYRNNRELGLSAHQYLIDSKTLSKRVMLFRPNLRIDMLERREEKQNELVEYFANRLDYLAYRRVVYLTKPNESIDEPETKQYLSVYPNEKLRTKMIQKTVKAKAKILRIFEKYHRNPNKNANIDIQDAVYDLEQSTISIKYHRQTDLIVQSTITFKKPISLKNVDEKLEKHDMDTMVLKSFDADPSEATLSQAEIQKLFLSLIDHEKEIVKEIRRSEQETRDILKKLTRDNASNELYNTNTDYMIKKVVEADKGTTIKNDYLAPYLKTGCNSVLKAKERCLNDFKNTFKKRANQLQTKYDQEVRLLTDKANSGGSSRDIEAHKFNIEVLTRRISRLKIQAKHDFEVLTKRMHLDERLRLQIYPSVQDNAMHPLDT